VVSNMFSATEVGLRMRALNWCAADASAYAAVADLRGTGTHGYKTQQIPTFGKRRWAPTLMEDQA
jgi:hypothetical protein